MSWMEDIVFKDVEHKEFFLEQLTRCRYKDVYHAALVYTLGINRDTRDHVNRIYDFETGCVKPECLHEGWQTSGSTRVVRMAFNLYCNGTPSVTDYDTPDDRLDECMKYAADELFCCGDAPFFWQALKVRYPEYCRDLRTTKFVDKEPDKQQSTRAKHKTHGR